MKTCPKCKITGIPEKARFCPNCGQCFFLYDGKGEESDREGFLWVDIRQCKRVEGLGWKGRYEFSPGLPTGFTGFYAVFDEERKIQIRVGNGKVEAIFVIDIDSENQNKYQLEISTIKKTGTTNQGTYFAFSKNGELISNKKDRERAAIVLEKEVEKLSTVFDKEFQDFFGIPFVQMMEHAEDWKQKSTSDTVERIIASIIFVGLMILGILMKKGVI